MTSTGRMAGAFREMRKRDPFLDRRSGEERRRAYSLEYFQQGNPDRRKRGERRSKIERRSGCVRITSWSSVCPDYEDEEYRSGRIRIDGKRKQPATGKK